MLADQILRLRLVLSLSTLIEAAAQGLLDVVAAVPAVRCWGLLRSSGGALTVMNAVAVAFSSRMWQRQGLQFSRDFCLVLMVMQNMPSHGRWTIRFQRRLSLFPLRSHCGDLIITIHSQEAIRQLHGIEGLVEAARCTVDDDLAVGAAKVTPNALHMASHVERVGMPPVHPAVQHHPTATLCTLPELKLLRITIVRV